MIILTNIEYIIKVGCFDKIDFVIPKEDLLLTVELVLGKNK